MDDSRENCITMYHKIWKKFYCSDDISSILNMDPKDRDSFENLLILGLFYPEAFYNKVEIAIPPHIDYKRYIRDNILHYENQIDKIPDKIKYLSHEDLELCLFKIKDNILISMIGGYPYFEDRITLSSSIASMFHSKDWFILLEPNTDKIINKDKINSLLSSVEDLRREDEIILAYGNIFEYKFYEIEEISHGIYQDEEMWLFNDPQGGIFNPAVVIRLMNLLSMIRHLDDKASILYNKIENALDKNIDNRDLNIKRDLDSLTESDTKGLVLLLDNIFDAGMYMRGWKGPNHPYPIKEKDTKSENLDFHVKVTELLNLTEKLFESILLTQRLLIHGDDRARDHFRSFFTKVKNGNMCIRYASKIFIVTAIWYKMFLFREKYPQIDINEIDGIS